jgi:Cdc6-like AAA superfamily ATPase
MSYNFIPFSPNQPTYSGMFAGRLQEISRIDEILFHAKQGNPTNIIITGERGIGKSSLLLVANFFSKGLLSWKDTTHNFLTVQISIDTDMTIEQFVVKIKNELDRELNKINVIKDGFKIIWDFAQRLEIMGCGLKEKKQSNISAYDSLCYSLSDTLKMLTTNSKAKEIGLEKEKDGIVLLIDEADNANKNMKLGVFIKNLTEYLVKEGNNKFLFLLSGLPKIIDVLRESHESSLRLFDIFELNPLTQKETTYIINKGVEEFNEKNNLVMKITDEAYEYFFEYSEGYPHFIQQIAYSTFQIDNDLSINKEDVGKGMFNKSGALEKIGDRYYKDLYFNKISVESYREILKIMSGKWNSWIKKEEIKKQFSGKESALNNGIKALRDRNIILSKKGSYGVYRLQWKSFAFWLKYYTKK